MYILIDPAITLTPNSHEGNRKQDVVAVAKRIEQQFPANNKLFSVTVDSCADLHLSRSMGATRRTASRVAQQFARYHQLELGTGGFARPCAIGLLPLQTFPCHFDYVLLAHR